jgi:hypothetical protein
MRDKLINEAVHTSCCGMDELINFEGSSKGGKISDEEWIASIVYAYDEELSWGDKRIAPLILFSGASYQKDRISGPWVFAAWLEKQGENIVKSGYRKNPNSGNNVQAWLWTPSARIKKLVTDYYKKNIEEQDRDDRYYSANQW